MLFICTNFLTGNTGLLYNTITHETITSDQVAEGGTDWMLLDANNANYAGYNHPAYYNTSVHQVLDSKIGSKVGDWVLTSDSKILYNTNTHETLSEAEITGGATDWMLLDANNSSYSGYTHPAYYNTSTHQVLDSSNGSKAGDWMLVIEKYLSSVVFVEKVTNPNPEEWANFGLKLSITDNFLSTGARYADILDNGIQIYDAGKVYVFKVDELNGTSTLITDIPSKSSIEGIGYGYTLSADADKLAVAYRPNRSVFKDINGSYVDTNTTAKVEIYDLDENGSATFNQTILAADNLTTRDSFGRNLHLHNDILTIPGIDYDSYNNSKGNATSRIYRYKLEANKTATLLQTITLREGLIDHFGEINFSQYGNRFVIGDASDTNGSEIEGKVSIYSIDEDGKLIFNQSILSPTNMLPIQDQKSNGFGRSVVQLGNLLVIGAYNESYNGRYVGSVYIYKFDQDGFAQPISKILPHDFTNDQDLNDSVNLRFGRAIEIKEKKAGMASIFVSAYHDGAGSVYEFDLDKNGTANFINKIRPPDGNDGDRYGISIESSENFLFVGAYENSNFDLNESGAFYTYDLPDLITDKNKSLYNPVTQEVISDELASKSNTSTWTKLSPKVYPGYQHPAYYSTKVHQVLESKNGAVLDGWLLTSFTEGASTPYKEIIENNSSSSASLVLYNENTGEIITAEDIESGTPVDTWISLSEARYGDKYQYPAYYNMTGGHYVVQNNNTIKNGWIIKDRSLIVTEVAKVLFNESTGAVLTQAEVLANASPTWMMLVPATEINGTKYYLDKTGLRYLYPAYLNLDTNGILDSSAGDSEGGWVLTDLSNTVVNYQVTISSSEGGLATGGGTYEQKTAVTLTATPSNGYLFAEWSGDMTGKTNPIVFEVTSNIVVTAIFAKDLTDSDRDGLSNYDELAIYGTDPNAPDSDGDGLSDKEELDNDMNPLTSEKDMVDKLSLIMEARGTQATPYTDGWFYKVGRGWLYTKRSIYPYFYDSKGQGWLYFKSGHDTPRFYEYSTKKWIDLGETE